MKKRILSIILALTMLIGLIPMGTLSAAAQETDLADTGFDPNNYKGKITKISVKEPYVKDGKTYLPMHVHFHVNDDISDSNTVWFMEGYNNVYMMDGTKAESLPGLGMTLMGPLKPDVPLEGNNMMIWTWNGWEQGGEGEILYNVPLLESSDTQEITQSQATGLTEVNGVKPGDQIGFTLETVFNSSVIPSEILPPGGVLTSEEVKVTVEDKSKYPKTYDAVVEDDKTVAPPDEVVLPYTGQAQECPYKDTQGYSVSLNDPQTDAGIYTAALILNNGWKWTDGTTAAKPAVWAINKATLTSVTIENDVFTYNGKEQHPNITSVTAGSLTVPADGYSVSYSETPLYGGLYTLTVKGKGNFTGSASVGFRIDTITAYCSHANYEHTYTDNQDGETHSEYCDHCGQCINNKAKHNIVITYWRDPFTDEYLGTYSEKCTLCEYERGYTCGHADDPVWVDNGDGTHTQRCPKCKKVMGATEDHDIVITPIVDDSSGLFLGQYEESCPKCGYSAEKTCDHNWSTTYRPLANNQHWQECDRCRKWLTETQEDCTPDENGWEAVDENTHKTTCTHCTNEITASHNCYGTRVITGSEYLGKEGWLFGSHKFKVFYKEYCNQCGVERRGELIYKLGFLKSAKEWSADLDALAKLKPTVLIQKGDKWNAGINSKYVMMDRIDCHGLPLAPILNGEMNGIQIDFNTLINDNGENVQLYDKNGNQIEMKKNGDDNSDLAPTGGNGDVDEEEGVAVSDLYTARLAADEPVFIAISTEVLATLADGEHSLTELITLDNGELIALTTYFTLATADDGQRMVTSIRPEGAMTNADGDIVEMNLSADTVEYTGEPITPPAVTLTSSMGVEYAEGDDYTLTYYRQVAVEGELTEVEVDAENITEIGTYTVVATPTRNGVLFGEAWAAFYVVAPAPPLLGDVDGDKAVTILDATYIQRYLGSMELPFTLNERVADVDGNGVVDIVDVTLIQRWLAQFPSAEGIGEPIDDDIDDTGRSALIGSWAYEEDEKFVYTFDENGIGTYDVYGEALNFTYTDNGTSVEIVFDDAPGTFDYSIDGNTLVLIDSTGTEVRYIKK